VHHRLRTLRQAPAKDTVKFLKTNPDVTFDLLSRVYSGTDGLLRRMAHLMGGSAYSRVLFEILIECQRFGKEQSKGYLIAIHENELARRAGLSRETVSRELHKIQNLHLVEVNHRGLVIKDVKGVEKELGSGL